LTSPPNVALAYALTPVFIFGIAIIFLKESASLKKIFGTSLAVIGAGILLSEHGYNFSSSGFQGDILALAASISWAIYTVLNKGFTRKYGTGYATALSSIGGTLLYLPIFYIYPVTYSLNEISMINWLQLLYLGIFTSAIAYAMWNWGLTKTEASKLAVFNNLQTIFTTLMSIFFLGYSLSNEFLVGGCMIIVGIYLTQKS
jgi:drug/metabolite transporter (DMT)-like permease